MEATFTLLPLLDRDLVACMRDLEYMTWKQIGQFFLITEAEARSNYEAAPTTRRKGF